MCILAARFVGHLLTCIAHNYLCLIAFVVCFNTFHRYLYLSELELRAH